MDIKIELIKNIIVIAVLASIIIVLWYKGRKKEAIDIIEVLVDRAEDKYGSGTGEYKYNEVVRNLYPALPSIVRAIISAKKLDSMIEDAVDKLQVKLEEASK